MLSATFFLTWIAFYQQQQQQQQNKNKNQIIFRADHYWIDGVRGGAGEFSGRHEFSVSITCPYMK